VSENVWKMPDIVRDQARRRGAAPALIFDERITTYRDLDTHANQIANGLVAAGVRRYSRVAVLDFNSDRYVEVFFGTTKAGGALVGINSRLAAPEVEYILADAGAEVLFVGNEHYELIELIESSLRCVRLIVALHGGHSRWPDYESWRQSRSDREPHVAIDVDDDFIQIYTSGTTGHPKGVCHTYRTWSAFTRVSRQEAWGAYSSDTVTLACMPLFHVAGFNTTCLTLLAGGCSVIARRAEVEQILRLLTRWGVTDTLLVPALIHAITSHPAAASADFSRLRTILYGAAPIAPDLLDRARELFGCDFVHMYGLTENLGGATYLPDEMHRPELGKLRSTGRAHEGLQLRIVDADGNAVAPGNVGEVLLRSPWNMRGYWRNPDATAEALRDGWLHTGDAGYLDADGYLYIHDRVKDMIVTGGENVYPAEVENALFGHPSIADVAVIGVPDDRWGEAVKALIVLKAGASLDKEAIVGFARARIAAYKLPKSIDVVTELPRNASGKLLRRVLREPFWHGQARRVH
jgi:acyl-CoA synthetase (AMP-forming)/AMP-acid ligase II